MRLRNIVPVVGLAVALATFAAPLAGALGTVSLSQNVIPMTSDQTTADVTVNWTGQKVDTLIFITVCGKTISDPTFNVALDCDDLTTLTKNGTLDGSGSASVKVFRGQESSESNGWGCYGANDTPPSGVKKNTTCYVRVTNNVIGNKDDAAEASFTFEVGGAVVPEAPVGVLLPVVGALAAVGGFFFLRRRAAIS
ncbi:hypothetical protein [Dermatobacter hominis]|uniref:hypothetical protein n=1 Tax=Dermatobacter hominis TaxID=2884263 RepID=UPI001D0FDFE3|nr:hypothetical protein [Dermatobacter hominis]UDY37919.1 hypothetical protein LH044_10325 [Dermatobacter hominis]